MFTNPHKTVATKDLVVTQRLRIPVLHVAPRTAITLILRQEELKVLSDHAVAGQRSKKAQMTSLLKMWFPFLSVLFE